MLLDAFLKFEGPALEGESTDKDHDKEIEVLSFEQTIVRNAPASNKTGTADKARSEHKPFTIIKILDKASPKLHQAASKGDKFDRATLSVCQPSGDSKTTSDSWRKITFYEVKMEVVHIARIHIVGDPALHRIGRATDFPIANGDVLNMGPLEEFDLIYEKIQWLYKGSSGSMNFVGNWNLKTNAIQ